MENVDGQGSFKFVTPYLRQETIYNRGFNTCYPTSVVNAAIVLGAINTEEARAAHEQLVGDLITDPSLWRGSNLDVGSNDRRIAEIVERHVPVRLGIESENLERVNYLVALTFERIRRGLFTNQETYVLLSRGGGHALAIIGWSPRGELAYVDPLDPITIRLAREQWFVQKFKAAAHGAITVTPVRRV